MAIRSPSQRGGLQRTVSGRTPPYRSNPGSSRSMRRKPSLKRNLSFPSERRPHNFARATIALGIAFVVLFQLHATNGASSRSLRDQPKSSYTTAKEATHVVQHDDRKHSVADLYLATGQIEALGTVATADRGADAGPEVPLATKGADGSPSPDSGAQSLDDTSRPAPEVSTPSNDVLQNAKVASASTIEENPATPAATEATSQTTPNEHNVSQTTLVVSQTNGEALSKEADSAESIKPESAATQTSDSQADASPKAAAVSREALARHVDGTPSVKLTESGQIDWDSIDHVYYYHTRKAG